MRPEFFFFNYYLKKSVANCIKRDATRAATTFGDSPKVREDGVVRSALPFGATAEAGPPSRWGPYNVLIRLKINKRKRRGQMS